jgi:hypothetical protein
MISQLDSVVVGVNDLSVAAADYAALTGSGAQEMAFRGESAVSFHMANTCLRLVETSERQGLKQLVFGCPDLDAARRRLPNVGVEIIDEASDDGFLALNPETYADCEPGFDGSERHRVSRFAQRGRLIRT